MEPPAVDDPALEPLWLYVVAASRAVVNLQNTEQRFSGAPAASTFGDDLKPWSKDGRYLVTLEDDNVVLAHDLVEGSTTALAMAAGATVLGWLDGHGPLFRYYYEAEPRLVLSELSGNSTILGSTAETALATRVAAAPEGDAFVYATEADSGNYAWLIELDGEESTPTEIASGEAISRMSWSSSGRYVAFATVENQLSIVNRDPLGVLATLPTQAEFAFSPQQDVLANFNGQGVELLWLDGDNIVSAGLSDATSGPVFSDDGAFLYFDTAEDDGALFRASDYARHQLEGYEPGCPLTFFTADVFLYQQCGTPERGLALGTVSSSNLVTSVFDPPLSGRAMTGPAKRCMVVVNERTIELGTVDLPFVERFTRAASADITAVALSANDVALAWVEGDDELYWLPVNADCTVSSVPRSVAVDGDVQSLSFLPQ